MIVGKVRCENCGSEILRSRLPKDQFLSDTICPECKMPMVFDQAQFGKLKYMRGEQDDGE